MDSRVLEKLLSSMRLRVSVLRSVGLRKREASIAVVKVPDPRIDALAEIVHPERNKYAEVTFLDFPPPEERKTGLETEALVQMRECEALTQVVRGFEDPAVATPADPVRDLRNFQSELILADLAVIEKRLERVKKEKGKEREKELLEKCHKALEEEGAPSSVVPAGRAGDALRFCLPQPEAASSGLQY